MLLVLCSRHDVVAHAFAGCFAKEEVRAVTCADLSTKGWKLKVRGIGGQFDVELAANIGEERIGSERIDGVITRLAVVGENELGHIVAEDRPYVAEEMRAFLFAFLEALPCPVVNPPSPACLCGPNLRAAQWRMFARQLQIPVADFNGNEEGQKVLPIDITVIGERILGHGPEPLLEWTRQLAGVAGVHYLMVRYRKVQGEYRFAGADPYPRLESPEIAKALVESFSRRLVRC